MQVEVKNYLIHIKELDLKFTLEECYKVNFNCYYYLDYDDIIEIVIHNKYNATINIYEIKDRVQINEDLKKENC